MTDEDPGSRVSVPAPPPQPSLIDQVEDFERWRRDGPGTTPTLPLPERNGHGPESDESPKGADHTVLPAGWRSDDLAAPRRRRRRFRWSVLLFVVVLGVAAAVAIRWLPSLAEDRAATRADQYDNALAALNASTGDAATATAGVADPASTPTQRSAALVSLARFTGATADVAEAIRRPLPSTPPFVPRDAIEELEPYRQELDLTAGRADLIGNRLETFLTYRTIMDEAFVLPVLPTQGSLQEINELSLTLASMLATSLDGLARFPGDPLLDDVRERYAATMEWFQDWEISYLESLRAGRPTDAALLVRNAETRVADLGALANAPLVELQTWSADELAGLRADMARAALLSP